MEIDVVLTGIGGQGVQLAATVLARAAVIDDKYVSMLGVYGGEMRGGPSGSTLIIGDQPVQAPPKVSTAWSIIAFHPKYWSMTVDKASQGTMVIYNSDLAEDEHDGAVYRAIGIPATSMARSLGSENLASMIMVATYARMTGTASLDALRQAMADSIPKYRAGHIAGNIRALEAGYALEAETGVLP